MDWEASAPSGARSARRSVTAQTITARTLMAFVATKNAIARRPSQMVTRVASRSHVEFFFSKRQLDFFVSAFRDRYVLQTGLTGGITRQYSMPSSRLLRSTPLSSGGKFAAAVATGTGRLGAGAFPFRLFDPTRVSKLFDD